MPFDFKTQLKAGKMGEMLYLQANPGTVNVSGERKCDFVTVTGDTVEIKTDFYSMEQTPNFFIERWSDIEARKPGGPWQASTNNVDYFVYMHVPNLTYWTFSTTILVMRLESVIKNLEPVNIQNKGWTTQGYRVPRALIEDIGIKTQLEIRKKGNGK